LAVVADSARVALECGTSVQKIMSNYRELVDPETGRLWFSVSPKRPKNVVTMSA